MRDILLYFSVKYEGDYEKVYHAIKQKEEIDIDVLNELKKQNIPIITIVDEDYPLAFRNIANPPLVLFYKGDKSIFKKNKFLAVVGSRYPSEYGVKATKLILDKKLFDEDIVIVSGLAQGIDSIAHQECLFHNGHTIAVLGCGIDTCFPESNVYLKKEIEEKGLVISEYPFSTEARSNYFPARNRIISALSDAIMVCDAKFKSGTQITVRLGLEQNKDILAIPHPIDTESFCNKIINDGATPVFSFQNIIELFSWKN